MGGFGCVTRIRNAMIVAVPTTYHTPGDNLMKPALMLLACAAALTVAGCSSNDSDAAASTSAAVVTTADSSAPTSVGSALSAPSDPRCTPASDTAVLAVESALTQGLALTNATVIDAGGYTYFGATIVDSAGETVERSDVWILNDGAVYASTGGARSNTSFPNASAALGASPGDDAVQAVDTCVVNITRGR